MKKIFAVAIFLILSCSAPRAAVLVGASNVVITPKTGSWMGGYMPSKRSSGVHDDVHVRCLVMTDDSGASLAMLSFEVVGMFKGDVDAVIKTAAAKSGIPEPNFLVSSIHTHNGPDVMGIWGGMPKPYFTSLYEKAATCVSDAKANARPATVVFGEAPSNGLNHNRRHGDQPVDDMVRAMQWRAADGSPIATVVNYGAHPVMFPFESALIGADYVGTLNAVVEKKTGAMSLFFLGAAGDVNPDFGQSEKKAGTKEPFAVAAAMGDSVANIALDSLAADNAVKDDNPKISIADIPFTYPVVNENLKLIARSGLARMRLNKDQAVGRMSVINIGPARMIAAPFELATDVWTRLRAKMPNQVRWTITFGQGYFGYVVPDGDYRVGDYESGLSLGPDTARLIVESATPACAETTTWKSAAPNNAPGSNNAKENNLLSESQKGFFKRNSARFIGALAALFVLLK